MKTVYDIWKHTKGLPDHVDVCLADYEDCWTFENLNEAMRCCESMCEHNPNANYYYTIRHER